jgi:hypothetical protein
MSNRQDQRRLEVFLDQIKLALKLAGRAMTDELVGPLTWDIWMRKMS